MFTALLAPETPSVSCEDGVLGNLGLSGLVPFISGSSCTFLHLCVLLVHKPTGKPAGPV